MLKENFNDRTNYVNKGKLQRDRRKLREKRRSTGVVHLQSTEVNVDKKCCFTYPPDIYFVMFVIVHWWEHRRR